MEATVSTSPTSPHNAYKSSSAGASASASSSSSSSSSSHKPQKSASGLKAFLQRARFDLNLDLSITSPPRRQRPARPIPSAAVSPPRTSIISEGEHKSDEQKVQSATTSSSQQSAPLSPLTLPSPEVQSKEHALPVHLIPLTLRSSSLQAPNSTDDMGGPGLDASRYARGGSGAPPAAPPAGPPAGPPSDRMDVSSDRGTPQRPQSTLNPSATSYSGIFGAPAVTPAPQPMLASNFGSFTSATTNGTFGNGQPTPTTSFFAAPASTSTNTIKKQENVAPAAALSASISGTAEKVLTLSEKIALLRASREAKKAATSGAESLASPSIQAGNPLATEKKPEEAAQANAEAIRLKNEQDAKAKAETERIEAERIEAERVEAERRAKVQAQIDALLAEAAKLEQQEAQRVASSEEAIAQAQADIDDVLKPTVEDAMIDKASVDKLMDIAQRELAEAEAAVVSAKQVIANLLTKAKVADGELDEAKDVLSLAQQELVELQTANALAAKEYKKVIASLRTNQARLERSLNGSNVDDVPALSTSEAAFPQTLRPVTPIEEDIKTPVIVAKDDLKDDEMSTPVAKEPLAVPPLEVKENGVKHVNGTWPAPALRKPSETRTVIINNIPITNTMLSIILRIVWGGLIHSVRYSPGDTTARVTFLTAEGAKKYLDATENGFAWPDDPTRIIITEPADPESGSMEAIDFIVANGFTRCVRVRDVDPDYKLTALKNIAEKCGIQAGGTPRKVERIINGHDAKTKRRIVDFRFCKIADAVSFKGVIIGETDFKECTAKYVADPCATATGVHSAMMSQA